MADEHLSWADLDALRTGEAEPSDQRHLDSCPACQAKLTEIETLSAAIRRVEPLEVPTDVDARILWEGRKRAAIARRRDPRRRWITRSGWAIAASLLLTVLATSLLRSDRDSAPTDVAGGSDVDGDGQVSIRDAFLVAKALADESEIDPAWDSNGDQVVDQNDVDAIARQAVLLRGAS